MKDRFYDPAIASDVDTAVDYALAQTGGDRGASIRALMKNGRSKTSARILYERHREALMEFFHVA